MKPGTLQRSIRLIMLAVLLTAYGFGQAVISKYAEGRVYLSSGFNLEGKNLRMTMETVTLEIDGEDQVMAIEDVVQVMAKRGTGKRYGKTCGIIGLIVGGLNILAPDKDDDSDEHLSGGDSDSNPASDLVGAVMVGGLSYGVGYFTGLLTDHWEVVYLKRS